MHIKKFGVGQIHYFLYLALLRVCDDRCHLLDADQFHLGSWSSMKEEYLKTISKGQVGQSENQGGQGLTLDILAQISHAPLERLEQDASVED